MNLLSILGNRIFLNLYMYDSASGTSRTGGPTAEVTTVRFAEVHAGGESGLVGARIRSKPMRIMMD